MKKIDMERLVRGLEYSQLKVLIRCTIAELVFKAYEKAEICKEEE